MTNHCGTCTACCRVYNIPELAKPANKWCDHCDVGHGCQIYQQRPQVCRDYSCMWLQSQDSPVPLAPELRPDRSRVVLSPTTDPKVISAIIMSPGAWQRPAMYKLLGKFVKAGLGVSVVAPPSRRSTYWDYRGQREVQLSVPDEQGMQWGNADDD